MGGISNSYTSVDKFELDHDAFTAWIGVPADPHLQNANFTERNKSTTGKTGAQIIHNTGTGAILYDGDGKGGNPSVQFALLTGTSDNDLSAGDFLIV